APAATAAAASARTCSRDSGAFDCASAEPIAAVAAISTSHLVCERTCMCCSRNSVCNDEEAQADCASKAFEMPSVCMHESLFGARSCSHRIARRFQLTCAATHLVIDGQPRDWNLTSIAKRPRRSKHNGQHHGCKRVDRLASRCTPRVASARL